MKYERPNAHTAAEHRHNRVRIAGNNPVMERYIEPLTGVWQPSDTPSVRQHTRRTINRLR